MQAWAFANLGGLSREDFRHFSPRWGYVQREE